MLPSDGVIGCFKNLINGDPTGLEGGWVDSVPTTQKESVLLFLCSQIDAFLTIAARRVSICLNKLINFIVLMTPGIG